MSNEEQALHEHIRKVYHRRIELGVAREQARKDLALSTYTEAYWKIDLHNLMHFLALRMDSHAQHEIRQYATVIGEQIVANWVPLAWEAFRDYRMNGLALSSLELSMARFLIRGDHIRALEFAKEIGWIQDDQATFRLSRECEEFKSKAEKLGLSLTWAER